MTCDGVAERTGLGSAAQVWLGLDEGLAIVVL